VLHPKPDLLSCASELDLKFGRPIILDPRYVKSFDGAFAISRKSEARDRLTGRRGATLNAASWGGQHENLHCHSAIQYGVFMSINYSRLSSDFTWSSESPCIT